MILPGDLVQWKLSEETAENLRRTSYLTLAQQLRNAVGLVTKRNRYGSIHVRWWSPIYDRVIEALRADMFHLLPNDDPDPEEDIFTFSRARHLLWPNFRDVRKV
jgi:hypothetical protein